MADAACYSLFDGAVRVFVEQGAVHLKTIERCNDPTELTPEMARKLAAILMELADIADAQ